ncbi:MAG: hypothetical protein Q8927_03440 [Bacteroidota bacterium]|nr:hypothetical protein [Bacteroidota bacterium]MDP4215229.1 hypothetical protein [Bacteroidota bacterium]MDP4246173.1 hypothetical protein [Bacteroidota bacterium]MDP4252363.1 hypothetical protein [Bacteroidota bacterium]MDP4257920.1 hypothetical protein [Bacteroidota bacterium]
MKRRIILPYFFLALLSFSAISLKAQYLWNSDSAFKAGVPNSGRLWGYVFGDYFHKGHSDSLNRGGNNQYTNVKKGLDEFQFRRIYIGYDYNISKKFSAEFLFAAEDDFTGTGDVLSDNKFTPYIKFANVRWKDFLFNGNDLVIGLQPTPAFPYMTENLFTFSRPVERTITDIRRTPSFDFGAGLQGRFNSKDKSAFYGYNLLVANGSSAKPQALNTNLYKWFYGDVFVGFLQRHLILDLYADYQRQNWVPGTHGHSARQMTKGALIWVDKKFTIGIEGYTNGLKQAEVGTAGAVKDTLDGRATGLTLYAHANIVGSKLRAFFRYDFYNPNTKYDNTTYTKYSALYSLGTAYEPNNKERFLSAGFDYSPVNNIHFIPNIWYNKYIGQQANLTGAAAHDYDVVYRLTFYFTFGKLFANPSYSYYPFAR